MRVVAIWKDNTDYAREMSDWIEEFEHETGKKVESLDPESTDGEIFVRARDILEWPAIVATSDDGAVLQQWLGRPLPGFDEVLYYAQDAA